MALDQRQHCHLGAFRNADTQTYEITKGGDGAQWPVCTSPPGDSDATGLVPHWSSDFPWMGLTGRIEFSPILAKMKNLGSKKEKGVIQILDAKDLERKGWNGKNTEPKEGVRTR